jgi:ribulose 1,5-bisphosphate synthetase/thiazole synthase
MLQVAVFLVGGGEAVGAKMFFMVVVARPTTAFHKDVNHAQ